MLEKRNLSSFREEEQGFYSNITQRYETEVNRFVPGYAEIVKLIVDEVAKKVRSGTVLDIGSGVGNLDEIIIDTASPQSMDLVEISEPMIEESKRRLRTKKIYSPFSRNICARF